MNRRRSGGRRESSGGGRGKGKPARERSRRRKPREPKPRETEPRETEPRDGKPRDAKPEPADEKRFRVVDPTSELLGQLTGIESKIPWASVGIALLCLLWLPTLLTLGDAPLRAPEAEWVSQARTPWEPGANSTAFARTLSRATWEWQGAEVDQPGELPPPIRARVRVPAMASGLAALLVFYFLGRLVIGDAAALLAGSLLAIAGPWRTAGASAMPLVTGELLVLLGVTWAITLQSRHREVQVAGVTATRIGVAGVFLGVGLLLAPTAFATFVTTLIVWFLLGLRRSSSDMTTLPVASPGETTFFAIVGTVVLAGATLLAAWSAEVLIGGGNGAFPTLFPQLTGWDASDAGLWSDLWHEYVAPTQGLGILAALAVVVMLILRWVEWSGGTPWQAAGLLPWLFLGGYFALALRAGPVLRTLALPVTVPPLFLLGLGWLLLRGLRPGRAHRQEYGFVVTWLLLGILLVPFAPAGHPANPFLAATIALLPAVLLVAARGARALWESEEGTVARAAVLVIAYLPVVVYLLGAAARLAGADSVTAVADRMADYVLPVLLAAVFLGIFSELVTVRPDPGLARRGADRRRRGRRGGRRRGTRGGKKRGGRR